MDPHSYSNWGGHNNRLLLHGGAADPGPHRLLHPGLEVVDPGCVFALLRLLPHRMVSGKDAALREIYFLHCERKLNKGLTQVVP